MVIVDSVFKVMMGEVDGQRSVGGGKWLVDVVRGGEVWEAPVSDLSRNQRIIVGKFSKFGIPRNFTKPKQP